MIRSRHATFLRSSLGLVNTFNARSTSSLARPHALAPRDCRALQASRPPTLALTVSKSLSTSQARQVMHPNLPYDHVDRKHELAVEKEIIEPHPEEVSETSSTHSLFHEKGVDDPEKEPEMLAGVYSDLKIIKATFALEEVPREALVIGLAGVMPYLLTSLSTVYLAFDINHASETGSGFLFSPDTAEAILHVVEPLQIGYGAVILSFLGAIHWGLEWAKYGGVHGYPRYAIGVVAPAIAWPTILLPVEYALISQFCAFTLLYFADARSVVRGWSPQWYSTYRFVLTFVVGASIVASLIGRGQIADKINRLPGYADRVKALKDIQLSEMETEERYKRDLAIARERGEIDDEDSEDEEEEED